MASSTDRMLHSRLGVTPDAGAWCEIGKIPKPPPDVHRNAGNGALRSGLIRPLRLLALVLASPLLLILGFLLLLASGEEVLKKWLATGEERERLRIEDLDAKRRDTAIVELGLNQTFDGDWNGAAGQFLLRWYGHSSHNKRYVALSEGRILLAAPPKRVSFRAESRMAVVAELPTAEAELEDPLPEYESTKLLLRFKDGSWIVLTTEEMRSSLHKHLMRHPANHETKCTGT
ncbi:MULTISPECIES: hypothetical protein [unclassified Streptomyces]|uniref:hypothetical protein n=1 Tax=unclassified Streptomyces TaxID=2593676 RepID=UPI0025B42AFF|nr:MULTISPECIES: hypothetical protein [unclassified Streptomyces]MDN3246223.1 hypothetical protein [Streptomyces sp. ZSW22]MDN3252551.1 hypothetical protein [Streptomyces sp. MA25(2023)]